MPITSQEIRQLRQALGLTQAEFAALVGVVPGRIAKWETGMATPRESAALLMRTIAEREGVRLSPARSVGPRKRGRPRGTTSPKTPPAPMLDEAGLGQVREVVELLRKARRTERDADRRARLQAAALALDVLVLDEPVRSAGKRD